MQKSTWGSSISLISGGGRRTLRCPRRNNWERTGFAHSSRTSGPTYLRSNSTESWRGSSPERNLPETPAYKEFLIKVTCPFCFKVQKDRINLIKHLDENCKIKSKRGLPFTTFQILSTNAFKCNICSFVILTSIKRFFYHAIENHQEQGVGIEFVFCSCCLMVIPATQTQLEYHMMHKIHNVRRKSKMNSIHHLNKGVQCIYCFFEGSKKFKCLSCPASDFLFTSPIAVFNHFKMAKHLRNLKKSCTTARIYCCFCDEEVTEQEAPYHFFKASHLEKEKGVTGEGVYELCFFCGFSCKSVKDMSSHMRSNCEEIKKIQEEIRGTGAVAKKEPKSAKTGRSEHKIKKERCILVEDNMDIIELVKELKKLGKVIYVGPYRDHKLVIEFKKAETVEFILLVSSFIKVNGQKVNIQFLQGAEGGELEETSTAGNI